MDPPTEVQFSPKPVWGGDAARKTSRRLSDTMTVRSQQQQKASWTEAAAAKEARDKQRAEVRRLRNANACLNEVVAVALRFPGLSCHRVYLVS